MWQKVNKQRSITIVRRAIVLLGPLLALSGCGGAGQSGAKTAVSTERARWAAFPIELHVDDAMADSPSALNDLQAALGFWENRVGRELFRYQGRYSTDLPRSAGVVNPLLAPVNKVFHEAPWQYGPQVLALNIRVEAQGTIRRSLISMDREHQMCLGDCNSNRLRVSFRKVLAHELGHFLGFDHHPEAKNIMFAFYQPQSGLNEAEVDWAEIASVIR